MLNTRFEEYPSGSTGLPFTLNLNIERTRLKQSSQSNWHEELELQWCTEGSGYLLLGGEEYPLEPGRVIVINSNDIHYTGSASRLVYHCLILQTDFCLQMGIDIRSLRFHSPILSPHLLDLLSQLTSAYLSPDFPCRTAQLHALLIQILIELTQHHSAPLPSASACSRSHEQIKHIIRFIRENYSQKLTLDRLAAEVYINKHTLCRSFKKLTGCTVITYLNRCRCQRALLLLNEGTSVASAAEQCGFDDPSFFCRTFKHFMGTTPSACKR